MNSASASSQKFLSEFAPKREAGEFVEALKCSMEKGQVIPLFSEIARSLGLSTAPKKAVDQQWQ